MSIPTPILRPKARARSLGCCALLLAGTAGLPAWADASNEDLQTQLANPVAVLVSVPVVTAVDQNIGRHEGGSRVTVTVQPVLPFRLNADWNLVTRTLVPLVSQDDVVPGSGRQQGLGDVSSTFFFTPARSVKGGWTWGAGPVLLLPTGTDALLTARKLGLGPSAVMLKQDAGLTYGALVSHVWSVAGSESRPDLNTSFLQPFVSKRFGRYTASLQTEATYDWTGRAWTVPLGMGISTLTTWGGQRVNLSAMLRYWATGPDAAPKGAALRLTAAFVFPPSR
jgi:hypothetical protein